MFVELAATARWGLAPLAGRTGHSVSFAATRAGAREPHLNLRRARALRTKPAPIKLCLVSSGAAEEAGMAPSASGLHSKGASMHLAGLIPLVPNWLVAVLYLYFAYRFYRGFERTTFDSSSKLILTLIWPLLLITGSGRRNLQRALRGDDT